MPWHTSPPQYVFLQELDDERACSGTFLCANIASWGSNRSSNPWFIVLEPRDSFYERVASLKLLFDVSGMPSASLSRARDGVVWKTQPWTEDWYLWLKYAEKKTFFLG